MDHNKESSRKASLPPEQTEGVKKDIEEEEVCATQEDAEDMFVLAKERLLDINNWHEVTTSIETRFYIVDVHGHQLQRHVRKGDYITIDIPAPGSVAGEGSDWVIVDALEYDDFPDENRELIAMRLRPVSNPSAADDSAAHFFTDASSSTFVIERKDRRIIARYYGRNEQPNIASEAITDKIRNTVVALGAILGFSDIQWRGLLKGFIRMEEA